MQDIFVSFNLHKQNTRLFWTHTLVPMRFGFRLVLQVCQSHQTGEWCVLSSLCREHYVSSPSSCGFNYTWLIRVRIMVFNTTFNNISVISWPSVLLVEETGVHGGKPPTCLKLNFITWCCIEYTSPEWDLNSQLQRWYA